MLKLLTLFRKSKEEVIFGAESEGQSLFYTGIRVSEGIENYSGLYYITEASSVICSHFNISEDTPVSIESLFEYGHSITNLHIAINSNPTLFKVEFESDDFIDDPVKRKACVFLQSAIIGNVSIGCFIAFIGGDVELLERNKWKLTTSDRQIGPQFVANSGEIIEQEIIDHAFNKFNDLLLEQNILTIRMV